MGSVKTISEATKAQILGAAWDLIAARGRIDVSQAEIAAAAGVSRQTVFYAFGARTDLLIAMVRFKDTESDHVARLGALAQGGGADRATLLDYVGVWLDYLPIIYPVGSLLDAASLSDPDAKAAWDDRIRRALLGGLRRIVERMAAAGPLSGDPAALAEEIWALIHPRMWRSLVVDLDWPPDRFREMALRRISDLIG